MLDMFTERIVGYIESPKGALPNVVILCLFMVAAVVFPSFLLLNYMYKLGIYSFGIFANVQYPFHLGITGVVMSFFASLAVFGSIPLMWFRIRRRKNESLQVACWQAIKESSPILAANIFMMVLLVLLLPTAKSYDRLLLIIPLGLAVSFMAVGFFWVETKAYIKLAGAMVVTLYVVGFTWPQLMMDGALGGFGLRSNKVEFVSIQHEGKNISGELLLLSPTEAFLKGGDGRVRVVDRAVYDQMLYLN